MDPNATLRLLTDPNADPDAWCDAFDALRAWISRGGFLARRLATSGGPWRRGVGGMAVEVSAEGCATLTSGPWTRVKVTE
jgi:hypothetical protein